MTNYKQATQLKLRFTTERGNLSVEQLWDLNLQELNTLVSTLEASKEPKKSYLDSLMGTTTQEDTRSNLMFEIALDVLTTKVETIKAEQNALADKKFEQNILSLIAEKESESLKNLSVEELRELLAKR